MRALASTNGRPKLTHMKAMLALCVYVRWTLLIAWVRNYRKIWKACIYMVIQDIESLHMETWDKESGGMES